MLPTAPQVGVGVAGGLNCQLPGPLRHQEEQDDAHGGMYVSQPLIPLGVWTHSPVAKPTNFWRRGA